MTDVNELAKRIESTIRSNLRQLPKDDNEKILTNLWKFIGSAIVNDWSQKVICDEATKLINRSLPFAEISLALRVPGTSNFKFEALVGFRADVERELRNRIYTEAEALGHDREPSIRIDNFLDFEMAEGKCNIDQEYEQRLFNRPTKITEQRKSTDEMKEGDYLALFFRGIRGELLGFVEMEAPRDRKLPQGNALKWLEVFGMIIGILLQSSKSYS